MLCICTFEAIKDRTKSPSYHSSGQNFRQKNGLTVLATLQPVIRLNSSKPMDTFYGAIAPDSSNISTQNTVKNAPLGIFTESQSSLVPQRLQRYLLQDQSCKLLPKERVCNCLKKRITATKNRSVKYNQTRKQAHYANVQRCGSIWSCPVCAVQITEKRKNELKTASDAWKNYHDGSMLLMTLTNSHNASHSLKSLRAGQKKAMAYFFGDREGKRLFALLGRKHHITNYEVTHGENGWHPHHHILLFVGSGVIDYFSILDSFKKHWINCCKKAGLPLPNMTNGLDIKNGNYASQYIQKWGIESEMTKGHLKKGRAGGLTPFDLLKLSLDDGKSGKLFQEFVIAFKGARQLVWSRGLKALLLIQEKTDEELAQETEKDAIELREVESLLFSLLSKYQKRAEFLTCLENDFENGSFGKGSAEQLINYVVSLEIKRLGVKNA